MRIVPRGDTDRVTTIVATAAIAPINREPDVREEQVSQLVLGETAQQLAADRDWIRLRTDADAYEGWVHRGYVAVLDDLHAEAWRRTAGAMSEGALITVGSDLVRAPMRARLVLDEDGMVTLPDGRLGRVVEGRVRQTAAIRVDACGVPPEELAMEQFQGSPYQWGGVTPWGVDCSGLVQTTWALRGVMLPRDSSAQVEVGDPVQLDRVEPGDLLFFRSESGEHITHVAFAATGVSLVHSTIACGGVLRESFLPGARAGDALRPRLVAARRVRG